MSEPFYRAYEDRYRGSRELIKSRLRVYEPFLLPLDAHAAPAATLDLGCGRGEWLEWLGELGFQARGVDLDEGMLAACHERGLDAVFGDALAALRACPDASLALVSAFHLVEHIPFEAVSELIAESLRALRPGGLLIMETPNAENLLVGASNFYSDPSHLRPLPSTLLSFATEHAGFARQHVLRLQEAPALRGATQIALFDVLAGVSPDYSVVAQKAAPAPQLASFDQAFSATYGIDLHTLAQRYDEAYRSEQWRTASALGQFEQRATAELNQLSGAFGQLSEAVRDGAATTDAVARQLQNALDSGVTPASAVDALAGAVAALAERVDASALAETVAHVSARIDVLEAALDQRAAENQAWRDAFAANSQATLDERLAAMLAKVDARLVQVDARLATEHNENAGQLNETNRHTAELALRLAQAEKNASLLDQQVFQLLASSSWRLTAPLRLIGSGAARLKAVMRQRHPEQSDVPPATAHLPARLRSGLRKVVRVTLRRTGLKQAGLRMMQQFPGLHARIYRTMYQSDDTVRLDVAGAEQIAEEIVNDLSPRSLRLYWKLKRAQARTEKH